MKKMKKALVIMNENHSLLPEQEKILKERFEEYEILPVPATGWTLEEMNRKIEEILSSVKNNARTNIGVVFVSPIPYMIMELARREVELLGTGECWCQTGIQVFVFHNDCREKKELPDGRIIQVVAREGWQLV